MQGCRCYPKSTSDTGIIHRVVMAKVVGNLREQRLRRCGCDDQGTDDLHIQLLFSNSGCRQCDGNDGSMDIGYEASKTEDGKEDQKRNERAVEGQLVDGLDH